MKTEALTPAQKRRRIVVVGSGAVAGTWILWWSEALRDFRWSHAAFLSAVFFVLVLAAPRTGAFISRALQRKGSA